LKQFMRSLRDCKPRKKEVLGILRRRGGLRHNPNLLGKKEAGKHPVFGAPFTLTATKKVALPLREGVKLLGTKQRRRKRL